MRWVDLTLSVTAQHSMILDLAALDAEHFALGRHPLVWGYVPCVAVPAAVACGVFRPWM